MRIIGKILEESLMFLNMKRSNVHHGKLRTLSKHMQMDVKMSTDANILMVGKNKNIILIIIKCIVVELEIIAKSIIVLITILKKIEDNR